MTSYFDTFQTSFGRFSVAVNAAGAVVATAFGGRQALATRLGEGELVRDEARTHASRQQILAYSAGQRSRFTLPLAVRGTAFQQRVWRALLDIPPGTTCSYGELARQIGRPTAARAVGRANATNPICLIVPCHRVIGADGSLTGFAFGEKIKRRLLAHERRLVAESAVA
jgi:methylated-DNA-[protein]-cysteine S-methyltransferase